MLKKFKYNDRGVKIVESTLWFWRWVRLWRRRGGWGWWCQFWI